MNTNFKDFTNLYQLSKTMRFELKPVTETQARISDLKKELKNYSESNDEKLVPKGVLAEDYKRAQDYKRIKKVIDEYHKDFIESTLLNIEIPLEDTVVDYGRRKEVLYGLQSVYETYKKLKLNKNKQDLKAEYAEQQESLRKFIGKGIQETDGFNLLFKKELFHGVRNTDGLLVAWIKKGAAENRFDWLGKQGFNNAYEVIELVESFGGWTRYFSGFHQNRENMYSVEAHSTSLIFRIVHDNLPKFLDNVQKWEALQEYRQNGLDFSPIERDMEEELRFELIDRETGELTTEKYSLDQVFQPKSFNLFLAQSGIDKFNFILGGKQVEGEREIRKGVNSLINLFSQRPENKEESKKIRSLKMTRLYKQILSDREEHSFVDEKFENDQQALQAVSDFYNGTFFTEQLIDARENILAAFLIELFNGIPNEYNLDQIHVNNGLPLSGLSNLVFGNWSVLGNGLKLLYSKKHPFKKEDAPSQKELAEQDKWMRSKTFSLADINAAWQLYFSTNKDAEREKELGDDPIGCFLQENCKALLSSIDGQYNAAKDVLKTQEGRKTKDLIKSHKGKDVEKLKNLLDSIIDLVHFLKIFDTQRAASQEQDGKKGADVHEIEKDGAFYSLFDVCYQLLLPVVPLYNKVRNYITQKPYSEEKFKLNFDSGKLLDGFTESITEKSKNGTQYGAYLFRKKHETIGEYEYFLGISKNVMLLRCDKKDDIAEHDKSLYERLEYYQVKSTSLFSSTYSENKDKLITLLEYELDAALAEMKESEKEKAEAENDKITKRSAQGEITPSKIITEIKKGKYFKSLLKNNRINNYCNEVIDEIKSHNTRFGQKMYSIQKVLDNDYQGAEGFVEIVKDLQEASKAEKSFSYFHVSQDQLQEALNDSNKPLYLFRIANKDLNYCEEVARGKRKAQKGKENLHTLYFRALMREFGDLAGFDLGKGELFYRPASIKGDDIVRHEKKKPILCKTYEDFNEETQKTERKALKEKEFKELKAYFEGKVKEGELSEDAFSLKDKVQLKEFDYDIIKHRTYTRDLFKFHLSVSINFARDKKFPGFNDKVNEYLYKNRKQVNVLSIDRGERHLAYYTLLTPEGKIIKQGTFNTISSKAQNGIEFVQDYHSKLAKIEGQRDEARKNWKKIENIKEMKEGYLSQVVHQIACMVVEYNAIVVFEDLNFGFKKGRFKVEKQVYQKMEKMLIDKLNFLIFKDKMPNETGGLLNGFQLTAPFESFSKMGKQTGVIYYVPAYHTSKICPATGFVNLLYPKYISMEKAKNFFGNFESIRYNAAKDYFEFSFLYSKFTQKAEGLRDDWTVCTYGMRLENFRNPDTNNKWDTREVNVTDELKALLSTHEISFEDENSLIDKIKEQKEVGFFKSLMRLLKLTMQMRNSKSGTEIDYLISPVAKDGRFFDSRVVDESWPKDADANGAYHIGLKGLWILEQIQKGFDEAGKKKSTKVPKLNLAISNKDWYAFAQDFAKKKK